MTIKLSVGKERTARREAHVHFITNVDILCAQILPDAYTNTQTKKQSLINKTKNLPSTKIQRRMLRILINKNKTTSGIATYKGKERKPVDQILQKVKDHARTERAVEKKIAP